MSSSEKQIPSIFLSYSWKDYDKAERIERDLKNAGIKVTRDVNMLYKESIKNFMKRIGSEDYAVLLISNSYLNSPNCMYEVLELLKNDNFEKKILPIILPDTKIFQPHEQLKIIKYWDDEIDKLNDNFKELKSLANISEILESIDHFTAIRKSISSFISKIKDLNCKSFKELNDLNYKPILDHIGVLKDDIIALTIELIKIQNLSEREIEIDKLLEKYPKNANLLFLKANLYMEEGKYKKAEQFYKKILESKFKSKEISAVYNNLGICFKEQKLFQNAIESYDEAIQVDPEEYSAYSNLALLYDEKLNMFEEAEKNYLLSLDKNIRSATNHINYAKFLCKKKEYFKAEKHYIEGLNLPFPNIKEHAGAHFCLARLLHINLFKFGEAKIQYEKSLELNPESFQTHCNFAVLLKNAFKDYEKAAYHYNEAIKINPKDTITLNNLGNLNQHHLNNFELAKYFYLKAIEFDENYDDSYNGIGYLLKDENPEKAKEYFEKGISINPNKASLQFNYAEILLEKFNLEEKAKEHYINAILLDFTLHTEENNLIFNVKSISLGI